MRQQLEALQNGGGGGSFDDMERRMATIEAKVTGMDQRLDSIDRRLDRIEDKALTEWSVAKVMLLVLASTMAAAAFVPRIIAMLP